MWVKHFENLINLNQVSAFVPELTKEKSGFMAEYKAILNNGREIVMASKWAKTYKEAQEFFETVALTLAVMVSASSTVTEAKRMKVVK